ncbi:MAG: DUF4349 domain-containing protein [Nitrososphaerales archaeon]
MQRAKKILAGRKIFVVVAFLCVALGVGYISQYSSDVTEDFKPEKQYMNEPRKLLPATTDQGYGSGTPAIGSGTFIDALFAKERLTEQGSMQIEGIMTTPTVPNTSLTFDRLVVFTANIEVNVTSVRGTIQDLQTIAYALGGYVSDSYVNPIPAGSRTEKGVLTKQANDGSITLRIPSKNFNEALNRIASLGELLSMTTSSRDVTDDYADLQSRIRNLQSALEQHRNIMKNATKISDILEIQSRIDNIQEQIERLKAQVAQTEKQASFALVTVHLREPFIIKTLDKPDQPEKNSLEKAVADVINMATSIAQAEARGLLVLTVGLLPIYPIFAVAYLMYRRFMGKKSKEI